MTDYPTLHTMVKAATTASGQDARHLIVHSTNGPSNTTLRQFASGVLTEIGTGTEYEMNQSAEALMREWAREGFSFPAEGEPVYEALERTVALATLMRYVEVFDPSRADVRAGNPLGVFPLAQWGGKPGKNGGGYQYAFTGTKIVASPTLPPGHGINMTPSSEKWVSTMQQILALQKTVGPSCEFVLG
jgi:hypothetical protein